MPNKNAGISILGVLILGFLLLFVLGYFDIRIQTVVENPAAQDNIDYVEGVSRSLWDRYLKEPARYLWNDVWLDIFWRPFIDNMKKLRDGRPSDLEEMSPQFTY